MAIVTVPVNDKLVDLSLLKLGRGGVLGQGKGSG